MSYPISLVIIAKNEEHNIGRCLASAAGLVSELLVIENGSQDRTREICQQMGARVLTKEWAGFGPQKAYGAAQAKYDWILSLDADEALSQDLRIEIEKKFSSLDPHAAYSFARLSFYMGRWIRHGGWYPDRQVRLFHRQYSMWNDAHIHEAVKAKKIELLNGEIHHWVFRHIRDQIETNNHYSSLQATELFKCGQKFSLLKILFKPAIKFFECYILKLGFLDGFPGFFIAVGAAYSVFLRWGKLWELQKTKNE